MLKSKNVTQALKFTKLIVSSPQVLAFVSLCGVSGLAAGVVYVKVLTDTFNTGFDSGYKEAHKNSQSLIDIITKGQQAG